MSPAPSSRGNGWGVYGHQREVTTPEAPCGCPGVQSLRWLRAKRRGRTTTDHLLRLQGKGAGFPATSGRPWEADPPKRGVISSERSQGGGLAINSLLEGAIALLKVQNQVGIQEELKGPPNNP